jgi:hypothetical protein
MIARSGDHTQWEQFAAQDPGVASIYATYLAVLGIIWAGFGLLAAIISLVPYRRGDRWAWYALWLVPIALRWRGHPLPD